MGVTSDHATNVPLVLDPSTGSITPNYHVRIRRASLNESLYLQKTYQEEITLAKILNDNISEPYRPPEILRRRSCRP